MVIFNIIIFVIRILMGFRIQLKQVYFKLSFKSPKHLPSLCAQFCCSLLKINYNLKIMKWSSFMEPYSNNEKVFNYGAILQNKEMSPAFGSLGFLILALPRVMAKHGKFDHILFTEF